MKDNINFDDIVWMNVNVNWLHQVMGDYMRGGTDLGMNYLSLGSLRYNENYFVGFIYDGEDDIPVKLVSYIQYKINSSKLALSYVEVAEKYRNNGVLKAMIDNFVDKVVTDPSILVEHTKLSYYGELSNIVGKFSETLSNNIVMVRKRDMR